MELNTDWKELFELFIENNVEFLLVGAVAMSYHGMPRSTGDIDIWVNRSAENAERVLRALKSFGVGSLQLTKEDFVKPDHVIQIGFPPRRVDLLTFLSGLEFEEVWKRRVSMQIEGLTIPVLCLNDLIINKQATGRPKDIADLAVLENRSDL